MVEGGMSCVKYLLGVFNFVFVIFAILLIVFGARGLSDGKTVNDIVETPDSSAIILIIVGIILFIIAFLGCWGAFRENHCMLLTFGVILVIILIIELTLGGLTIAFKNEVRGLATEGLNKTMSKYDWTSPNSSNTVLVDELQEKLKCCGINSASDWLSLFPGQVDLPSSCCDNNSIILNNGSPLLLELGSTSASVFGGANGLDALNGTGLGIGNGLLNEPSSSTSSSAVPSGPIHTTGCALPKAWKQGCVDAIEISIKDAYGPLGGVAIAVAIVQLLGVIFACCLASTVKKEYEVV